jgi:hypothetical protein
MTVLANYPTYSGGSAGGAMFPLCFRWSGLWRDMALSRPRVIFPQAVHDIVAHDTQTRLLLRLWRDVIARFHIGVNDAQLSRHCRAEAGGRRE